MVLISVGSTPLNAAKLIQKIFRKKVASVLVINPLIIHVAIIFTVVFGIISKVEVI